jgi:hypothetical protein
MRPNHRHPRELKDLKRAGQRGHGLIKSGGPSRESLTSDVSQATRPKAIHYCFRWPQAI